MNKSTNQYVFSPFLVTVGRGGRANILLCREATGVAAVGVIGPPDFLVKRLLKKFAKAPSLAAPLFPPLPPPTPTTLPPVGVVP